MKSMKRVWVLLTVVAMLFVASGYAEGQREGAEANSSLNEELALEGINLTETPVLTLEPISAVIDYSQNVTLTAATSSGDEPITWTSSDVNVAEISAVSGQSIDVTGINAGVAMITCTSGELTQICTVTVNAPGTLQITGVDYPSTFQIGKGGWRLRNGTLASTVDLATLTTVIRGANGEPVGRPFTYTFDADVKRYDIRGIDDYIPFSRISTEGTYTWTLSAVDVSGRSVSMNLPIHAVASEETVISNNPGVYSSIIIASDISVDNTELVMQLGETKTISATVLPDGAVNDAIMWVSDDPSIAVVSPIGEVTGIGIGSTTITCRTLDNSGVSASCVATVLGMPASDENENSMNLSEEYSDGYVNDIETNGRNLILNSSFSDLLDAGIYKFNGDEVTFSSTEFNAEPYSFSLQMSNYGIENIRGKTLAFSMEYRIDEALEFGTTNPWVGFELDVIRDENTGGESQWLSWYGGENIPTNVTSDWVRYICTVDISDYDVLDDTAIVIFFRDTKGTIRFRHPKIEIVGSPLIWSPAPEDVVIDNPDA